MRKVNMFNNFYKVSLLIRKSLIVLVTFLFILVSYIYICLVANNVSINDYINQKICVNSDTISDNIMSKERNGVIFTINKYEFDGYKLKIEYEISGKKNMDYEKNYPYLSKAIIKINSDSSLVNQQEEILYKSENSLKGFAVFCDTNKVNPFGSFLGQTTNDLINKYNINLKFTINFSDESRSWEFDFSINSNHVKDTIKKYNVNNKIVKSVVKTPVGFYLNSTCDVIVMDDKGRQYKENKYFDNIYNSEFALYSGDIKWIKIIPYDKSNIIYNNIDISLNSDGFLYSENNEIEIENVKREKNRTLIYYRTKYQILSDLIPIGNIKFKGNEPQEDGLAVLIINEKLEDGTYSFQYKNIDKSYNIKNKEATKIIF